MTTRTFVLTIAGGCFGVSVLLLLAAPGDIGVVIGGIVLGAILLGSDAAKRQTSSTFAADRDLMRRVKTLSARISGYEEIFANVFQLPIEHGVAVLHRHGELLYASPSWREQMGVTQESIDQGVTVASLFSSRRGEDWDRVLQAVEDGKGDSYQMPVRGGARRLMHIRWNADAQWFLVSLDTPDDTSQEQCKSILDSFSQPAIAIELATAGVLFNAEWEKWSPDGVAQWKNALDMALDITPISKAREGIAYATPVWWLRTATGIRNVAVTIERNDLARYLILSVTDYTNVTEHRRHMDAEQFCTKVLSSVGSAREVLPIFLSQIQEYLGVSLTAYLRWSPNDARHLEAQAYTADDQAGSARLLAAVSAYNTKGVISPLIQGIVTGEPYVSFLDADISQPFSSSSILASLPVLDGGATIGALVLQRDTGEWSVASQWGQTLLSTLTQVFTRYWRQSLMYDRVIHQATHDALTGTLNKRSFESKLKYVIAQFEDKRQSFAVAFCDIDHFKRFNDQYGHPAGDAVLKAFAATLQQEVNGKGFAARYGGEEFILVLTGYSSVELAAQFMESVRRRVESLRVKVDGIELSVTMSVGIGWYPSSGSVDSTIVKAADIALYTAKRRGRNRVVMYDTKLLNEPSEAGDLLTGDKEAITIPSGADLGTIQAFIQAVDLRDGYTARHSASVAEYAVEIGQLLGLQEEGIETLRIGGLLHDIGKIGISDTILQKQGPLTAEERQLITQHTVFGDKLIANIEQFRYLRPLIRWHHERLDGSGYPDHLTAEQIPQLVRILSVADVFDAIVGERPYHPARPYAEGVRIVREEAEAGRLDRHAVSALEIVIERRLQQKTACIERRGDIDLAA